MSEENVSLFYVVCVYVSYYFLGEFHLVDRLDDCIASHLKRVGLIQCYFPKHYLLFLTHITYACPTQTIYIGYQIQ